MKLLYVFIPLISITLSCEQRTTDSRQSNEKTQMVTIDSTIRDTVKQRIEFISDSHFSSFKTPIEARFIVDGQVSDSILKNDFSMMSWYSYHQDTIDLVAHVGEFETEALVIRFLKEKPIVLVFRSTHENGAKYFKTHQADTSSHQIEVKPVRYHLKLSEIPDTTNKQIVFGYIDLETDNYYDERDSAKQKHKAQLKFYFRSQYRKFAY